MGGRVIEWCWLSMPAEQQALHKLERKSIFFPASLVVIA